MWLRLSLVVLPVIFVVSLLTALTVGYAYTRLVRMDYVAEDVENKLSNNTQVVDNVSSSQVLGQSQGSLWFSTQSHQESGQKVLVIDEKSPETIFVAYEGITSPITVSFYPISLSGATELINQSHSNNEISDLLRSTLPQLTEVQSIKPWGTRAAITIPKTTKNGWLLTAESSQASTWIIIL